jgi:hypothetical protein
MEMEPFVFRHAGYLVGQRSLDQAVELLTEVNRFALQPLTADDVAVFTMDLCHNQIDRHFSRFPDEELDRINAMVPGRPLMERHDLRGTLPRGTFFRSRLNQDGERVSVRPDVYVLRTGENHDFIRNIEGGVYRETSIGFSFQTPECSICAKDLRTCDHIPGRTYGGELCHFVMRDVVDVIEGSVVPSGSQGTGFVAQTRALPVNEALTAAREAAHRPIEIRSATTWANE